MFSLYVLVLGTLGFLKGEARRHGGAARREPEGLVLLYIYIRAIYYILRILYLYIHISYMQYTTYYILSTIYGIAYRRYYVAYTIINMLLIETCIVSNE